MFSASVSTFTAISARFNTIAQKPFSIFKGLIYLMMKSITSDETITGWAHLVHGERERDLQSDGGGFVTRPLRQS